eukprot:CAMPEP_0202347108 /NCGR_PEP_ID=MMETSP1126-20121109/5614_1 /ASSEMBLY_ACC=CAM_ASM_000457 /TAXON_ID=3047 /ORGANISM="Dunaliella tertiolecta, Strain CCMP1320" /LENGTH=250 /DNA_ID=CAMNT_0048938617 /DNA_START=59 /DNA_END=812 /DNA_ORIENTATION=+
MSGLFEKLKSATASKAAAPAKAAPSKKAAAPKRAASRKVSNPPDLEKWYGPERKLFLPGGLLDRDDVPEYLNGELAGDYGYDPLGLGKDEEQVEKYRANELLHARWAMLAAAALWDEDTSSSKHGPAGVQQLIGTVLLHLLFVLAQAQRIVAVVAGQLAVQVLGHIIAVQQTSGQEELTLRTVPLLQVRGVADLPGGSALGGGSLLGGSGLSNPPDLEKWYGPERKLFLPGGLLDRDDVPEYLNGELAGE